MKLRYAIAAVVLLLTCACLFAYRSCARNPLRGSEPELRSWLLEKTPIGSTREHVLGTIDGERWIGHPEYRGFVRRELQHVPYFSYGAQVGRFRAFFPPVFVFRCDVEAFWVFGPDDRVTDVFVSSYCHGM